MDSFKFIEPDQAISKISYVQQKNLDKWTELHPNWQNNSDLQEEYLQLIKNCTDGEVPVNDLAPFDVEYFFLQLKFFQ